LVHILKKRDDPALEDLGFTQQAEIFDFVRNRTKSVHLLLMQKTCWKILNEFCEFSAMQSAVRLQIDAFPGPGMRETDGLWPALKKSTRGARRPLFVRIGARITDLPERLREVYDRCRECYEQLYQHRLR